MKRQLLVAEFLSTPWALMPERLAAFAGIMHRWSAGGKADAEVMTAIAADKEIVAARKQDAARVGQGANIAVLPFYGVVTQRGSMADDVSGPGAASTQKFTSALRQALQDPSVGGILIDIDSPGGSVYGVDELANEIMSARAQKPIIGLANSLAASAAYWVGAACSELYVTPGGEVGSIGVWQAHEDWSKAMEDAGVKTTLISAGKFKTEGNPYQPLGEDAQAFMQSRVDDYYAAFTKSVAKGRSVSVSVVREDFGQGRVYGAAQAQSAGMVNGVMTFDDVVKKLAKDIKANNRNNNATTAPSRLARAQRDLALLT
ncbi:MAG: S49 family peptidase [Polaromonas sp.]|nr:S49 family peptidase [Polaromonas sp.]